MTTERPSVNLSLTELDPGSWVIFALPGFPTAASGTEQSSLDALRTAGRRREHEQVALSDELLRTRLVEDHA